MKLRDVFRLCLPVQCTGETIDPHDRSKHENKKTVTSQPAKAQFFNSEKSGIPESLQTIHKMKDGEPLGPLPCALPVRLSDELTHVTSVHNQKYSRPPGVSRRHFLSNRPDAQNVMSGQLLQHTPKAGSADLAGDQPIFKCTVKSCSELPPTSLSESEYRLLKLLASNNEGTVALMQSKATGETVIVKSVSLDNHKAVRALAQEASLLSQLHHPNLVRAHGTMCMQGKLCLVLEYLPGGDLFDAVLVDIGLPEDKAIGYFIPVCDAVKYMHSQGIAHRDLKPENVVLTSDGRCKVIDLGLASPSHGHQSKVVGTVPYMAPEVLACGEPQESGMLQSQYDPKLADSWSLGIILFALYTGRFPWSQASTNHSREYCRYLRNDIAHYPWCRLGPTVMPLLKGLLSPQPSNRWTVAQARDYAAEHWPATECSTPELSPNMVDVETTATLEEALAESHAAHIATSKTGSQWQRVSLGVQCAAGAV